MSMNEFAIVGPAIYTDQAVLTQKALTVRGELIHDVTDAHSLKNFPDKNIFQFPDSYHLVPGFIDMHIHGVQGCDVMDADDYSLQTICDSLAKEGTTAFLATTMTADVAQTEKVLASVNQFIHKKNNAGAEIIGLHLEGPFLSAKKMGAQRADALRAPDIQLVQHWQALSGNHIKLITLAPEYPQSLAFIQYLKQQHILASLGHTNATYAECVAAIHAGCTQATHLFNAMSGIHQREPGAVTAALLADEVMVELIVDGVHLHPAIVELTFKMKGKNKIALVTDAIRAKCMCDGHYDLGGQMVEVKNAIPRLADGTLAGSVLSMPVALKNMMAFTGCDLATALLMVSANPAKALGIYSSKGSITKNKDADLVVLDEELNVVMTVCRGSVSAGMITEGNIIR